MFKICYGCWFSRQVQDEKLTHAKELSEASAKQQVIFSLLIMIYCLCAIHTILQKKTFFNIHILYHFKPILAKYSGSFWLLLLAL